MTSYEDRILTVPNLVTFVRLIGVGVFWWLLLAADNVVAAAWLISAGPAAQAQQKPKELLWTHAFDLASRKFNEPEPAAAESPRWAEIAERCLSCANCTLVCPTCFCTSVVAKADLDGSNATSERTGDSCFTFDFAGDPGEVERARKRQQVTIRVSRTLAIAPREDGRQPGERPRRPRDETPHHRMSPLTPHGPEFSVQAS